MESDLSPASILSGLKTSLIGGDIVYYPTLPSTMLMARELASEGAEEGMVVIADEQTAGRGRLGREWLSPAASGVFLSVVVRPDVAQLPQLNMIASLAVVESIEEVTGLKPVIKWPNDVLLNDKKVCGILIENFLEGGKVNAAIVGIGLNVNFDPSAFPEIAATATGLSLELGREVSRREMVRALLEHLDLLYQELRRGQDIRQRWLLRVETLKKWVKVRSGDVMEEGRVESIEADGGLVLRRADGSLVTMIAGEVTTHV